VEFRCSLYLFLVLLGTSRLQPIFRYMTLIVCIIFSLTRDRWDFVLFMMGMGLVEFDHIQGIHTRPNVPRPAMSRSKTSHYAWIFACFAGLYLLSRPSAAIEKTPGWYWLCAMVPKGWNRFFKIPGATLFVMAVGRLPSFQRFFNRPTVQYFARISYALYLVHGPVIHVVGYKLEQWIWGMTGVVGWWYYFGLCLSCCFTLPVSIWAADVFWRAFDTPTANFAKWLEAEMIKED
jgi:peptidoglycan/LPS O-acetylase OafA/YrhL